MTLLDELIMSVIYIVMTILDFFPDIPSAPSSDLRGFVELVGAAAYFLPIGVIAQCAAAMIALHLAMNSFWIVNWVIKRIRGG